MEQHQDPLKIRSRSHSQPAFASLDSYLAVERRRLETAAASLTAAEAKRNGRSDYAVLWGLIALQVMAAIAIVTILYPLGGVERAKSEMAAFNAPQAGIVATPIQPVLLAPAAPTAAPSQVVAHVAPPPAPETLAEPARPPSTYLHIRGIEITQGIQVFDEPESDRCRDDATHPDYTFCNNSVPLVAGRHTVVRVYLACNNACPAADTTVSLRLLKDGEVRDTFSRQLPAATLAQINQLPLTDLRLDLNKSINFEFLPPPTWLSGQITFELEASLPAEIGDSPAELALTRNFASRKPLRVAYLPIHYQGVAPPEFPNVEHWLLRLYPVPGVEYYRLPVPDLIWERDLDKSELLNELLYIYWLYTQHQPPENWPDQLFGWLPQEFYNGGASDPAWCAGCAGPHSSRVAFGGLRPEFDIGAPRILAHEIAHNLGARHAWSPTEQQDSACFRAEGADIQVDPEWPYAETPFIQEVGIDLYSQPPAIYAPSFYDMMSYCTRPWISPHTYRKIFDSPLLQPDAIARIDPPAAFDPGDPAYGRKTLLISGLIYSDGAVSRPKVVQVETNTPSPLPIVTTEGQPYCLVLEGHNGATLVRRCFKAGFLNGETGLPTESSPFFLTLPHINPDSIAKLEITRNDLPLITLKPSQNPPQVSFTQTAAGASTVAWQAFDADSDRLTYDLLYSLDEGQTWLPLATDLRQAQYSLDNEQLSAAPSLRLRVLASDGFHTGQAETEFSRQ